MVSQSGTDASRPECAADVDVESRLDAEASEPPDPDCGVSH